MEMFCLCHYFCTTHDKTSFQTPRALYADAAFFLPHHTLYLEFFCLISWCLLFFPSYHSLSHSYTFSLVLLCHCFLCFCCMLSASSLPKTVRNMSLVSKQEKLLNYDSYFESVSAHDFWYEEGFFSSWLVFLLLLFLLLVFFSRLFCCCYCCYCIVMCKKTGYIIEFETERSKIYSFFLESFIFNHVPGSNN